MQLVVEAILGESQMGFCLACNTTDATWVLCNLIEWSITMERLLFLCFVNLRKAYDNINKEALLFAIAQQGIPNKLVGLLTNLHERTHAHC
jgi:hypothetical protein